jgi:hypothetical protein
MQAQGNVDGQALDALTGSRPTDPGVTAQEPVWYRRGFSWSCGELPRPDTQKLVHYGFDLAGSIPLRTVLENGTAASSALGEGNPLANGGGKDRQIVACERFYYVTADCRIYDFTIYYKSGFQLFLKHDCFVEQVDDLFGSPDIVGRWLHRDQHQAPTEGLRSRPQSENSAQIWLECLAHVRIGATYLMVPISLPPSMNKNDYLQLAQRYREANDLRMAFVIYRALIK